MRVALYQCYKCHTEVLGFLIDSLARDKHEVVIYNEPASDASSFVHFYEDLFGTSLEIRPCHALASDHAELDAIIMATADDPMSLLVIRECPQKIVAVQHERVWHRTEDLSCHVGLSPYVSDPFMFPVYEALSVLNNSARMPARAEQLHLAIVGHVSESKHLDEIHAFLASSTKTRMTFMSRQHSRLVHTILTNPAYVGRVRVLNNLATHYLMTILGHVDIDAIWVPVRSYFDHSSTKLTGALPLAYNLKKRILVPDMIATAYGLDGAIVYASGVEGFLALLDEWDARTEEDWKDLAGRATAFVRRTVESNRVLLSRMLSTGDGAAALGPPPLLRDEVHVMEGAAT